ncbi:MAG: GcrA-like regulator [Hyphomicrobiales bacterium]|nr:GcrA-like regulator [Hyphomicrobiales bacterium]
MLREATWTPERVDRLRNSVNAGLTCSQIADEIGVTRNAVIGKIHRLGIGPGRRPAALAKRMRNAPAQMRPTRIARIMRVLAAAPSLPSFPSQDEAPAEQGSRCSLLELACGHCRWPIGDPNKADFGFCGHDAVAGLSYCAGHARLAYRLPSGRRA